MNYQETIQFLFEKLPMFSRIGDAAIKKDLTNTLLLCDYLGNPQHKFKSIHIAGTNGKGSVSHMLASVLQAAGYKTGLYTSPHLKDFRERIKINGKPCSEKFVIQFTKRIHEQLEIIKPSFFEITVAMAFDYFAEQKVDVAIIETGLGGRLDSTNVITPLLSIITNISYDHQHLLGNSLKEIAQEKAGIIKPTIPVLVGRKHPETNQVFIDKATSVYTSVQFAEEMHHNPKLIQTPDYLILDTTIEQQHYNICSDLKSVYQGENLKTALAAIHLLNKNKDFEIHEKALQIGFSSIQQNTGLQGRWQVLEKQPKVIADVGHNEDGIKKMLEQLNQEQYKSLHIVFGMVKDKEIENVLKLLPKHAHYYFTEPQIPRKLPVEDLISLAEKHQLQGASFHHPKDALGVAKSKAAENDLILITGSFFVVGEII